MYSCTLYMPKGSKLKWKGLLAWLATLQRLQHTCTCFRMTVLCILGCGRQTLGFLAYSLPTNLVPGVLSYPSLWSERERERPWLGLVIVSRAGLSESFEVDGWVVNVSSQRGGKPLGGSRGHAARVKFVYLDTLKCCFLHSPGISLPSYGKSKVNYRVNYITACRH